MISEEVYSSSVSLTVEEGVSLVGEHCPGTTVRLFCEGVDLTQLEWRLYHAENMYFFKIFSPDSVNETRNVSILASASVELVRVSQDRISKVFANFSSILTLELSQTAIEIQNITRISCGDAETNNDTMVNISIVKETLPNVSNFSVRINTSSIFILAVTWKQYVSLVCNNWFYNNLVNCSINFAEY